MPSKSIIKDKSFLFAVRIVNLYKFLIKEHKEYVLSKQVLRSGTSIGALCRESINAESKKDFIHKLNIALKEANETSYWLELLCATVYINKKMFNSLNTDSTELIKMLTSSVKTSRLKYV